MDRNPAKTRRKTSVLVSEPSKYFNRNQEPSEKRGRIRRPDVKPNVRYKKAASATITAAVDDSGLIKWGNRDRRWKNATSAARASGHREKGPAVSGREVRVTDGGRIVDGAMNFRQAVFGSAAPPEILEKLCLLDVRHTGFDGLPHRGQLLLHRDLVAEIGELFSLMEALHFPVSGAVPIVRYGWSDEASMADDNCSAFNYRPIAGTDRLSLHASGRAVDINPRENPAVYPDGRVAPAGAVWRPGGPGTFSGDHPVVLAFLERGWRWGGHFDHMRDYHHFEK